MDRQVGTPLHQTFMAPGKNLRPGIQGSSRTLVSTQRIEGNQPVDKPQVHVWGRARFILSLTCVLCDPCAHTNSPALKPLFQPEGRTPAARARPVLSSLAGGGGRALLWHCTGAPPQPAEGARAVHSEHLAWRSPRQLPQVKVTFPALLCMCLSQTPCLGTVTPPSAPPAPAPAATPVECRSHLTGESRVLGERPGVSTG